MKFSIIAILCVMLLAPPGIYAKERLKNPVMARASKAVQPRTIIGKTLSVTYADMEKGTKSEIVLTDGSGTDRHIIILDTTTMYDEKGRSITRDNIQAGRTVKVKYTANKAGIFEARSIRMMIP